ncbi:thioredoxin reductase [Buchnera aphidicola (Nipponaphis monzeni)]|uniref:Thioredoxin reductase n=1 Tax=Buchnera aphidicola (Nipponaphis monzeni) TaxID=2495405 RepID=A0A455TA84_9GAMM|nr:thioredoxin-disulfide reductase [Buchnera aphidicola]BBI01257.1 thioredoxin reductase [Buchnera aphidicola (Nipponaphis monzeni)]
MKIHKNKIYKLIIIGTGPAGYTASIYSARANLNPLLITGPLQGGQLINTNKVENWPGQNMTISGFNLMNKFYKQSIKFKTEIIIDEVEKVFFKKKPIVLIGTNTYITHSLIIATGANPRYLGLQSENIFKNKGISTCAICDGFFYKNKEVAVVGGGNTALEEALYLSKISNRVHLIHRNNFFKAEKILVKKILSKVQKKSIILYTNFVIKDILGDHKTIKSIQIQSTIDKKCTKIVYISGLFIAIGSYPNTKIFDNQLKMHNGYINTKGGIHGGATMTSIPGIFAAGDVVDHIYKQAITAAASGCMAAIDAEKYLENYNS